MEVGAGPISVWKRKADVPICEQDHGPTGAWDSLPRRTDERRNTFQSIYARTQHSVLTTCGWSTLSEFKVALFVVRGIAQTRTI